MTCTPKMRGCKVTCRHFRMVDDYRQERARQYEAAVEETGGHQVELARRLPDLVSFRSWLIDQRRNRERPASA